MTRLQLKQQFRAGLITALAVISVALGGVAYAYWSDSGTVTTSGTIASATTVPMPVLQCPSPQKGQNTVATWSMPAGYQADYYRVWMSYTVPGTWQGYSGGATLWGNNNASGTWYWPANGTGVAADPLGKSPLTTTTSALWGVTTPGTSAVPQNNSGTLYVAARIGTWESAPATATWDINYYCSLNAILVCMAVDLSLVDCNVTASS